MTKEALPRLRLESRYGNGPWQIRSTMNDTNYRLSYGKITLDDARAEALRKGQQWSETVRDGTQFRVAVH